MSNDDALFRFRLRLFALAKELGSVRAACRMLGVHHSMYYPGSGSWSASARRSYGRGSVAGLGCRMR